MKVAVAFLAGLLAAPAMAAPPWQFGAPIHVSSADGENVFHHLESAGRRNIAVSSRAVAVIWEDNRTGTAQVYVAVKEADQPRFNHEQRVSGAKPSYEPVAVALAGGRFLYGWEEADAVWLRAGNTQGFAGPAVKLADSARQITMATGNNGAVYAAWAQDVRGISRIHAAQIGLQGDDILITKARVVDTRKAPAEQQYPSAALFADGSVCVAWEDRSEGHTRILFARAPRNKAFTRPITINEIPARLSSVFGRGTGAARPALTPYEKGVAAVWLDKRDFQSGYDVYVAFDAKGTGRFGPNQKVQDSFGEAIAQWHPTIAATGGDVAVAWDDDRDETADVLLSWPENGVWSDDLPVPGASGPGHQSDPVMAFDEHGNLHLAWIHRAELNGPSRVLYLKATR